MEKMYILFTTLYHFKGGLNVVGEPYKDKETAILKMKEEIERIKKSEKCFNIVEETDNTIKIISNNKEIEISLLEEVA